MKQKITSAVLATAVLVSVTGCQKSPKSPNNAPPSTTPNLDWLINYEPPAGTTTETKATTTATTNAPPTLAATTTVVTNAEVEAVAEEPPIVFLGDPVLPADSASARNLPVIRLSTATGKQVTSRTEYIGGTFAIEPRLSDTDNTNNGWYLPFEQTNIKVRGRGNTSWTNTAKKSYRIKFGSDVSPFGLPAANSWVLIANYNDPSFVRDKVAYAMERVLDFDFVPTAILVDLYLNDDYIGVYNFGDVIEVEDGRLEMYTSYYGAVASGYLLEIGGAEKGDIKNVDYFDTKLLKDIAVKAPDSDDVLSEEQLNYIKS
ncbi:MAG: CotH kinase family protein, partial [Oscillospiraceae bacterium]|nr:CotH kinase family protein [Oscillospiraceae bacterium]